MNTTEYRSNDIKEKLDTIGFMPLDILVVGGTGVGKSSTLNTIFDKTICRVGDRCDPETTNVKSFSLNDYMRFWDSLGLGDSIKNDKKHEKKLIDSMYLSFNKKNRYFGVIDMILVLVDGGSRDIGTPCNIISNLIIPNFQSNRILVAINQADVAMRGRHWDTDKNKPDPILNDYLKDKANSIQQRIRESTGVSIHKPVCFSAEKGYHIKALMNLIINNMPTCPRPIVNRKAS